MGVPKPWEGYFEPIKIFGNLYFVGTKDVSTHILDTGDGYVMFDSGYQHTLHQVIHNMHLLGLSPNNLKYIIHTHGHIDHFGATKSLVALTGAKTVIGRADRDYANGKRDLSYAKELQMDYTETFEPDVLLDDGDVFEFGNCKIYAVATPGHTEGATSYFFDVTDGSEVLRAGLHGGAGLNTLNKDFLNEYNLPFSLRDDYINSMLKLNEQKIDIFLGNHMKQSKTIEKAEKLKAGDKYAFVDKEGFIAFNLDCIKRLKELIEGEK